MAATFGLPRPGLPAVIVVIVAAHVLARSQLFRHEVERLFFRGCRRGLYISEHSYTSNALPMIWPAMSSAVRAKRFLSTGSPRVIVRRIASDLFGIVTRSSPVEAS